MAKFYGRIGYEILEETSPGVWTPTTVIRTSSGDTVRRSRRLDSNSDVNDDINISEQISILADPYAFGHFHEMKWVERYGTKWKITSIDVEYPRLILTVGGVYNDGYSQA